MRNSQRVVLGVIGVLAGLIVALGLWAKFSGSPVPELSGQRTTRSYSYANFDGVAVSGQWQITIARGDAWGVSVEVPVEAVDRLEVEVEGDTLEIGHEGWWFGDFGEQDSFEVTVTMPALTSIELSGASQLSFSGFEGERLSLTSSGASEVRAASGRFDTLTLVMSGAGNVDLDGVAVTNAEIQTSGAGNLTLNMAGGRLTGSMSGAGNLDYRGTVSEQSVSTSGIVTVRRRD